MTARHTRLSRAIWDNPDFSPLTAHAKLLYLHLISSPKISLIGALDHTPGRWSRATSLTRQQVDDALTELEKTRFVLVDLDFEEVTVRSFVRHDVQVTNPKMAKAVWSAWAQMGSATHRVAILDEIPEPAWVHAPEAALVLRPDRRGIATGSGRDRQCTLDFGSGEDRRSGSVPGRAGFVPERSGSVPLPPPSPTSLLPPPTDGPHPHPVETVETVDNSKRDDIIEQVLQAIADHQRTRSQANGRDIRNPTTWRATVIRNARTEHLEQITRLIDTHPDAPPSLIAGAVLGDDARNLNLYRSTA